jgi:hypothetical protein
MSQTKYRNRRSVRAENDIIRVTVTVEGGHVAEILHKPTGTNPLWTPSWPSIEPTSYDPQWHPEYGSDGEAKLLSGIMGHNLCLDLFGSPSPEELAAGIPVHGEAAVIPYDVSTTEDSILMSTTLPNAQLRFKRQLKVVNGMVLFSEALENLSASDRPIGWTEHVTLGSPFLELGQTQFRVSATHSMVIDSDFNGGKGMQKPGAQFEWPWCPLKDGTISDLRVFTAEPVSGGFTAHLMDPTREQAFFLAWSPSSKVLIGYIWKRRDFPWLARWEENHLRTAPPWNGAGLACGMEFGLSPFVESRREMVARSKLFGTPTFGWIPAKSSVQVEYCAFVQTADSMPASVRWDGGGEVLLS